MAERKVLPNTQVITLSEVGGTEKLIVCLTQTGYNMNRNAIDSTTFCGTDSLPGTKTFNLPFSGQRILVPDATHISEKGLFDFISNGTRIEWTLGPVTPATGDIVYTGEGYLNTFNTSNPLNGVPTMDGTIDADTSTVACAVTA